MADSRTFSPGYATGVTLQAANLPRNPVVAFSMGLGLLLAITFVALFNYFAARRSRRSRPQQWRII